MMTGSARLRLVCFQICFQVRKLVEVSCMLWFQQRGRSQNDVSMFVSFQDSGMWKREAATVDHVVMMEVAAARVQGL